MRHLTQVIRGTLLATLLAIVAILCRAAPAEASEDYTRRYVPEFFTFEELVQLSQDQEFDPDLTRKHQQILHTPFLSNEAYYRGVEPLTPDLAGLGRSLQIVMWNIERGIYLDDIKLMFTDKEGYLENVRQGKHLSARHHLDMAALEEEEEQTEGEPSTEEVAPEPPTKRVDMDALAAQIDLLHAADVLVLNEVDWGMKRTDYREVIVELGEALDMNWVYGVEFIEIDPKLLGTETFDELEDEELRRQLIESLATDHDRLRALHGTAILSRYPIAEAEVRPFEFQGYDWYHGEKDLPKFEKRKRKAAGKIGMTLSREMRRGGRMTLIVHLAVPELPEGRLTILAPHLENRTSPKNRRRQMEELLDYVRGIENPLVIAGDLNTTLRDDRPESFAGSAQKTFGNSSSLVAITSAAATGGASLPFAIIRGRFNSAKNQSDPTARNVRFFAPNPERGMFDLIEKFRFDDGKAFDLRGDKERSFQRKSGSYSNSNERAGKGFKDTFRAGVTVGAKGKYKLDWLFVKSYLEDPRDTDGPYRFAPHFGQTMNEMNYALPERLSDHGAVTIDLPFAEPDDPGARYSGRREE
jgi:endonuclease/exonuclease/phosphatase family metal-dependent hydrolase